MEEEITAVTVTVKGCVTITVFGNCYRYRGKIVQLLPLSRFYRSKRDFTAGDGYRVTLYFVSCIAGINSIQLMFSDKLTWPPVLRQTPQLLPVLLQMFLSGVWYIYHIDLWLPIKMKYCNYYYCYYCSYYYNNNNYYCCPCYFCCYYYCYYY